MWTKQPIDELVRLIEWINYPQNTSKIDLFVKHKFLLNNSFNF
jgi:hypothetical protein